MKTLKFNSTENSSEVQNERNDPSNVNKTNKNSKQSESVKSSGNKKLNFEECDRQAKRKRKNEVEANQTDKGVSAKFYEEGDTVEFEVEGQATDFNSEEDDLESDSDNECEGSMTGSNINTNRSFDEMEEGECSMERVDDEVTILKRNPKDMQEAEEKEMMKFVNFMKKQGLVIVDASDTDKIAKQRKEIGGRLTTKSYDRMENENAPDNNSEVTIYKNAVEKSISKRDSLSSDEPLDTSEELEKIALNAMTDLNIQRNNDIDQFLSEAQRISQEHPVRPGVYTDQIDTQDGRYGLQTTQVTTKNGHTQMTPTRSEEMVREAEKAKARIYDVKGKANQGSHSLMFDEDYIVVGSHVDDVIKRKIAGGEYIDFSKLLTKERVSVEDDHCMELVNKGGLTYWVPMAEHEAGTISSFIKWEQAFRVYSNIFTAAHPSKAGELIQYNHIIHTASQMFAWENVYKYDREFRIHMSKHHPFRSWAVILQQAWSMFLKDQVTAGFNSKNGNNSNGSGARRRLCFDFNRGSCSFGKKCKFNHRCSFCNKFGHGAHNCRKAGVGGGKHQFGGNLNQGGNSGNSTNMTDSRNRWEKYEKQNELNHGMNIDSK